MRKIIIVVSALLTLVGVAVATAAASSASTSGEACVFNAPNVVLIAGKDQGHVGWSFKLPGGNWEFGANDGNTMFFPSHTWYQAGSWTAMLTKFAKAGNYTQYRCATVPASNAWAAQVQVINEQNERYIVPTQDCESQTDNVLAKYGVKNLPGDVRHPSPNIWFSMLNQAGFGSATHLLASAPAPTTSSPPKIYVYSVYHTCANGACGLKFHSGPGYSNYPVTRVLVDGNAVDIVCQTRGQSVSGIDGSSSNVWDKTAQGDYAADFYIDTPGITGSFSPPIPEC